MIMMQNWLPDLQMEIAEKERRVRYFLNEYRLDALILSRRENFAWFTCGSDSTLALSWPEGGATLVITPVKKYLVAYSTDIAHFMEEEVRGQGFEAIAPRPYTGSTIGEIEKLISGRRTASDMPLPGAKVMAEEIIRLHYPLTRHEIARYHEVGSESGEVMQTVATELQPGESELQIAGRLLKAYKERGFHIHVLLVGADARVARHRHPFPTFNRLDKYALLAMAVSKYGLHVLCSRMVHFGSPPSELVDKHRAVATIHAHMVANCVPGNPFAELHALQRRLFDELGYPDEWNRHFQGGMTGYNLVDASFLTDPKRSAESGQAFGWFITITGVKTEETCVIAGGSAQILSYSPDWPTISIQAGNRMVAIPDILVR
jgi:Xaa-Pro dipeptidase